MKSAKQRKDSVDSYREGGREDLVEKELAEVSDFCIHPFGRFHSMSQDVLDCA